MNDKNSFQNKPLKEWDTRDISQWLASIGMKPYVSTFKNENITGKHLCKFVEEDLRTKCKIAARPIRKILFKRLKHVQGRWKGESDDENDDEEENNVEQDSLVAVVEANPSQEANNADDDQLSNSQALNDLEGVLSPEEAAFKIKSMYQCWKAHLIVVKLIQEQYIKIYSLETGRYVYKFIGRATESTKNDHRNRTISKLAPIEPLKKKPLNLGSSDLSIQFTRELAIMRIQLFARYCCTIKMVRAKTRQRWKRMLDSISGKYWFFHPNSGAKSWMKPKLLGRERWDPMDMRVWSVKDVQLYFRKLRIGRLGINEAQRHEIDGPLLLVLQEGDLYRLGMPEDAAKKILNDIKRVDNSPYFEPIILRRRDSLRDHYRIIQAAITIQTNFRRFIAQCKWSKLINVLARQKSGSLSENKIWWSDYRLQILTVIHESSGERQKLTLLS